ncbi:hypothetical protein AGR8A_Cc30626 [Agrobacterium fabrum str. J-07]|nr:hypothetical protein AGR8A_Cc30626 [Agrobacterium fabrum str. J-07]
MLQLPTAPIIASRRQFFTALDITANFDSVLLPEFVIHGGVRAIFSDGGFGGGSGNGAGEAIPVYSPWRPVEHDAGLGEWPQYRPEGPRPSP